MFKFVVMCGCLMAIADAGIINGGFITGLPVNVQPGLAYQPSGGGVALPGLASASSSNIIRGIGPITSVLGGRGLIGTNGGLIGGIGGLGATGLGYGGIGIL